MSNVTFIGSDCDCKPSQYIEKIPAAEYKSPLQQETQEKEPDKELPSLLTPMAILSAGFFAWELLT